MGWEGELILRILPRRNSLDERECRSRSLTIQTSLDRAKRRVLSTMVRSEHNKYT